MLHVYMTRAMCVCVCVTGLNKRGVHPISCVCQALLHAACVYDTRYVCVCVTGLNKRGVHPISCVCQALLHAACVYDTRYVCVHYRAQ